MRSHSSKGPSRAEANVAAVVVLVAACSGARGTPPVLAAPVPAPWRPVVLEASRVNGCGVEVLVRNRGRVRLKVPTPLAPYFRIVRVERSGRSACVPPLPPDHVRWVELEPAGHTEVHIDVRQRCVFATVPPDRIALVLDVPPGAGVVRDAPDAWTGRSEEIVVDLRRCSVSG